jgi:phosphate:Na+ symporter
MVLLTAAFVANGLIGLKVGLFLVLGANLGSGLIALLATAGAGPAGRRVALGNLFFRVIGCLMTIPLLGPIEGLLAGMDPDPQRLVVNFPYGVQRAARGVADLPHRAHRASCDAADAG